MTHVITVCKTFCIRMQLGAMINWAIKEKKRNLHLSLDDNKYRKIRADEYHLLLSCAFHAYWANMEARNIN